MSRTAHFAVGMLLSLICVVLAALPWMAGRPERITGLLWLLGIFGGLALLELYLGTRFPYPRKARRLVTRKLNFAVFALGLLMIVGSVAVLWVQYSVELPIVPDKLAVGSLLGVPVGTLLAASVISVGCVRCDRLLTERILRVSSGDLEKLFEAVQHAPFVPATLALNGALEGAKAEGWMQVHYCEVCRDVAILRGGKIDVILEGAQAAKAIYSLPSRT